MLRGDYMSNTIKAILESQGINWQEFEYIEKTSDNISLRHIKTGKKLI